MSKYGISDKADNQPMRDALKGSQKRRMKCATTDLDYDKDSKQKFDENYERIFGKQELKHGRD